MLKDKKRLNEFIKVFIKVFIKIQYFLKKRMEKNFYYSQLQLLLLDDENNKENETEKSVYIPILTVT